MSVVDYHTVRASGSPVLAQEDESACARVAPMRYRGWVLLALGIGSWAGLFKICGWL